MIPLGYLLEYEGWPPEQAWARTVEIVGRAEALGFASAWAVDHFHTNPLPKQAPSFESFVVLTALGSRTREIRLGHLVLCAGYRNPALVAKMVSTLDVVTSGRITLGIGAGWKEEEWAAYGYTFPPLRERLDTLRDQLGVISAMLAPGPATYTGQHASVHAAINEPRGVQAPRIPILVGGNGPKVTWRLAARFADELNLDGLGPDAVRDALPIIASRCEEIDRDPATLRISVQVWSQQMAVRGPARRELLAAYADLGIAAVMGLPPDAISEPDSLDSLAEDAAAAGVNLQLPSSTESTAGTARDV